MYGFSAIFIIYVIQFWFDNINECSKVYIVRFNYF